MSYSSGKSQGNILLRTISTLRQICSHGGSLVDTTPYIQTAREHNICDKCGDPIDAQNETQKSFHDACGHSVCYECTLDQNSAENTTSNSTPATCWVCQEPVTSVLEGVLQQSGNQLNSTLMDWQPTKSQNSTVYSSKIEKVVINLRKLEQASPTNRVEPIKRYVSGLILIHVLTKNLVLYSPTGLKHLTI